MNMKTGSSWNLIRALKSYVDNIPAIIVDMIAVKDILRLCVFGLSNKTIATQLDVDEEYVKDTIDMWYSFGGWDQDLILNPYTNYISDYDIFVQMYESYLGDNTSKAWSIVLMYKYIKKEIDRYEGN